MKFFTFGPVVSEEKSFESVDGRRTDGGGFPYYKLPRSLRLRGAKKAKASQFFRTSQSETIEIGHLSF